MKMTPDHRIEMLIEKTSDMERICENSSDINHVGNVDSVTPRRSDPPRAADSFLAGGLRFLIKTISTRNRYWNNGLYSIAGSTPHLLWRSQSVLRTGLYRSFPLAGPRLGTNTERFCLPFWVFFLSAAAQLCWLESLSTFRPWWPSPPRGKLGDFQ
jgi:hypothetical protein